MAAILEALFGFFAELLGYIALEGFSRHMVRHWRIWAFLLALPAVLGIVLIIQASSFLGWFLAIVFGLWSFILLVIGVSQDERKLK